MYLGTRCNFPLFSVQKCLSSTDFEFGFATSHAIIQSTSFKVCYKLHMRSVFSTRACTMYLW